MGSKLEGPEREWNVAGKDLDGKVNAREGSGEEWVGGEPGTTPEAFRCRQ